MKILLRAPNVKCPSRKTIQRNSYLILQHPTLLKHKEKGNRKEAIVRETAEPASTFVLDQKATELISALENTRSLDDIFCVGSRCFSTPTNTPRDRDPGEQEESSQKHRQRYNKDRIIPSGSSWEGI